MKKLLSLLSLGLALSLGGVAHADEKAKEPTAQQERMKTCNAEAKGKTGDERKKFMSQCLKGDTAPAKGTAQQERMKTCNAEAKGKTGDERKKFMSQCLKSN